MIRCIWCIDSFKQTSAIPRVSQPVNSKVAPLLRNSFWWGSISLPTTFWHSHTFPLKIFQDQTQFGEGTCDWTTGVPGCPCICIEVRTQFTDVAPAASIWDVVNGQSDRKPRTPKLFVRFWAKSRFFWNKERNGPRIAWEPFVELWCFTNHTFKQRWSHAGSLSWCHLCQVAPVHFEQWENAINQMATKYPKLNGNLSRIVQRHDLIHSNCRIFELFDMFMFCVCNMNIGRKRKVALADLPHQTIVEVDHPPNSCI